jgi:hypothetical protein
MNPPVGIICQGRRSEPGDRKLRRHARDSAISNRMPASAPRRPGRSRSDPMRVAVGVNPRNPMANTQPASRRDAAKPDS